EIFVRPALGNQDSVRVDEPNALPVREGGRMNLQAQFHQGQRAYPYLVWIDSQARVLPLYPWNLDELDVQDANAPPPARIATGSVRSPGFSTSWKFGKQGGLETVLLLARRTPLPEGVRLGDLIGPLPPVKAPHPTEVAVLGLGGKNPSLTT